ncbi:MAG TPA: cytochrome c peroxidase [Phenylobacterium sp.]
MLRRIPRRSAPALIAGAAMVLAACGSASPPPSSQASFRQPATGSGLGAVGDQVGLPIAATLAAIPADNPQTPEKVALGARLFFDRRLSVDGSVACGSCHNPARAFTDGRAVSVGIQGRVGQRNAPTILNALYDKTLFWDGRTTTLEDQAVLPILNPSEMGQPDLDAAVAAIAKDARYQESFQTVFGRAPNGPDLVRAIASYERSEIAFTSPFDAFIAGDADAISDSAKRGWALFETKARCSSCHAAPNLRPDRTFFMDNSFHNTGVGIDRHNVIALACRAQARLNSGDVIAVDQAAIQSELSALGSFLVTKQPADIATFKTPSLRNVLITAPYFHDGSERTLWDVMDHYNKGGMNNPWLDRNMQPLALSEKDIEDLIAFMASLTSAQYREQGERALARQREIAHTMRSERDMVRAFSPKPARPDPSLACVAKVAAAGG